MLLGAIDIGSNAVRLMIGSATNFEGEWKFQRVEYLRYPLRLGEDVFKNKPISPIKIEKFTTLIHAFKDIFTVFEVTDFQACATSAMRDAINGKEVIALIKEKTGVEIKIIDGQFEADLMDKSIDAFINHSHFIHIDVGGGSTEINIFVDEKKVASKSFNIGTVRAIQQTIPISSWNEMKEWLHHHLPASHHKYHAIGTGGNIKKLHELLSNHPEKPVSLHKLKKLKTKLIGLSIEERMQQLDLNQDRADVIVPAASIFINIMQWTGAQSIIAPNIGLVDGIIQNLFQKQKIK